MTVHFTSSPYERSHMSKPRGRGSWAFQLTQTSRAFDRDLRGEIVWSPGNMTLTEAKRAVAGSFPAGALVAVLP